MIMPRDHPLAPRATLIIQLHTQSQAVCCFLSSLENLKYVTKVSLNGWPHPRKFSHGTSELLTADIYQIYYDTCGLSAYTLRTGMC